ncbi:type II toxin-antitoxin system HicA family toxin [Fibrobacter intestinalis]|uniref:Predicted RNA binding protein YcfA, dsRBD-like fold, HicA-like mRNA interferase family n=2 Tax=Fibrobacter TaxID=832 RepID=A0A1T4S0P0_9BACT|nr:type II toxin-antitoxin system HicA family toxin [Fibrobacter intestinalis]PBC73065.1 putative RNA binding protein YcfA (HicA-like mRNA interferase family) [Fibrobacter sp. NR9]PBC75337.1 putative RNA binding protein YcfA (HicA-like mRNA interferase family) [Fibrobacter sp. NR9]SKA18629.1 Predicted RNA binding protein YcfA, dsRBD-like fold, HicA-like mRNA interferase family [Fibrobacter intestinalis]SKA21381.1 Predicted RNA binding protein YcfA, dsRBD-like fold, HicA-like mRNA interferase fa
MCIIDMKAREVKKMLEDAGFRLARIHGSHWIYEKKGFPPIPVPDHGGKDLKPGTLNRILKMAGLK